jgi:hypothetical protein
MTEQHVTERVGRRRGRRSAGEIEATARLGEANARVQELEGELAQRTSERDVAIEGVDRIRDDLRAVETSTLAELASMRAEIAARHAPHVETPRAYVLQRSDLSSLGRGKGIAQSMHAGNAMTWQLVVAPLMAGGTPDEDVMAWHREAQGFGTTIAVGNEGEVTDRVIASLLRVAHACGIRAGDVVDGTYPYRVDAEFVRLIDPATHTLPPQRTQDGFICFRREVTGLWLFGRRSELDVLIGRYALTADD